MKKNPKVSVLMPIYKTKEEHLREAIDSILSQTFKDFEFLILDDCPSDDREDIVKSYQDERIKYIKNEHNLGITPSRNKLIDMAKGEYLAVMDHDDISLPKRFEKQVAYLDKNSAVGIVGCWAVSFPEEKKYYFPKDDKKIKETLMSYCSILHPSSMIRKKILIQNKIQYEEEFSPAEDYNLWITLIKYTKFANIPQVLFKYRWHDTNTTRLSFDKQEKAAQQIKEKAHKMYPKIYKATLSIFIPKIYIKLFKIIPFLRIVFLSKSLEVYLFNFIPLISLRIKKKK